MFLPGWPHVNPTSEQLQDAIEHHSVATSVALRIEKWLKRTRVRAKFLSETYDLVSPHSIRVRLDLELTNMGESRTALDGTVSMSGLLDEHVQSMTLKIEQGSQRQLEPHTPVTVAAVGTSEVIAMLLRYKRYQMRLSKGPPVILYIKDDKNQQISWLRWRWGRTLMRLTQSAKTYLRLD